MYGAATLNTVHCALIRATLLGDQSTLHARRALSALCVPVSLLGIFLATKADDAHILQVYNASNNELVRTNTLVKGAIIQVDATPYRQWYEAHVCICS